MWSPPSSGPAPEQALISLTVLNGLRVCEAAGADIKAPGVGRGPRTLTITPQGRQRYHKRGCVFEHGPSHARPPIGTPTPPAAASAHS
jgi:hypothetical protein